jgi:hypothetical protein
MMAGMFARMALLVACLVFAAAAAAETVYKYRRADGRTLYSNRLIQGLELIETFEYRFEPPPAAAAGSEEAAARRAEISRRIERRLADLQQGWDEVQEAQKALAAAEEKLGAGAEPLEEERFIMRGPMAPKSPAVGGPKGQRLGGGVRQEYFERQQKLQADVDAARARLDAALRRYNQLR